MAAMQLCPHLVTGVPKEHFRDEEHAVGDSGVAREEVDERRARERTPPDTSHFRRERQSEVEP